MASTNIIHVTEIDFQNEVLSYSSTKPVVVDFWAAWCGPCRSLTPILERLTDEAGGSFRLAKLDVDANPNIAMQFGVRSIPAVKAFRNGQIVAEFVGLRPEPDIREWLKNVAPSTSDVVIGRAAHFLAESNWSEAEGLFREALEEAPDDPAALLGLARSLLAQGQAVAALPILREFPISKAYTDAEKLLPLAENVAALDEEDGQPEDLSEADALFYNALRLAQRGQLLAAMDGLLDVLRADKHFRQGLARNVFISILTVLGDDHPDSRQYRQELATLLF